MKRLLALFALLLMPLAALGQFAWPTYPVTSKTQIYKILKDNGSGVAVLATNDSTNFLGINQNAVTTTTGAVQILPFGPSQVLVGSTPVTMGELVTSDVNGNITAYAPATDGAIHCYLGNVIGLSKGAGAANTYVYVNVTPSCARSGASGGGAVTSVFGRTGAVVAVSTDYTNVSTLQFSDGAGQFIHFVSSLHDLLLEDNAGDQFILGNTNAFSLQGNAGASIIGDNSGHVNIADVNSNQLILDTSGFTLEDSSADRCNLNAGAFTCTTPISSIGGQATQGTLGVPLIVASSTFTGRTTALGTTTLFTVGATTGTFNVEVAAYCDTTVATATVTLTVTYTDPSSTVITTTGTGALCTTLGNASQQVINLPIIRAKNATVISWAIAIANSPNFDATAIVKRVQ